MEYHRRMRIIYFVLRSKTLKININKFIEQLLAKRLYRAMLIEPADV